MKNLRFVILFLLVIALIIVAIFLIKNYTNHQKINSNNSSVSLRSEPYKDRLQTLRNLLAKSWGVDISKIDIRIIREDQEHIRGFVIIINNNNPTTKIFLAAKVAGNWQIVFDGQGANCTCSLGAKYGFPPTMTTDCTK